MSNLQVLTEQEVLGQDFKIYGNEDDPLFLAKDIAEWIEHNNITHMMNVVDDDEKLTYTLRNSGQNREMWFLTEEGLYEVLMQSRKPIAKAFKKQVKNILKEIRKTGRYETPKSPMEILELQFKALKETTKRVDTVEKDVTYLKEEVKLEAGEYSYITKRVHRAVTETINNLSLAGTREVRSALYKDINNGIHEVAGIKTRTQLRQKHFNIVINFIHQWTPATATLMKTRQITLELAESDEERTADKEEGKA